MTDWSIIRCVGARERSVADELRRGLGLHSYHPQEHTKIVRRSSSGVGRVIDASRPLMPNYLFVLGIEAGVWRDIKSTKGVIGWVTLAGSDEPASITDAELTAIRELEREFNRAKVDTRRALCVGDRVKITKGPFMDIETLITSVRGAKVEFMSPMGKATVPAASVSLVA
jgi:transcription antitermination factor NusG